MSYTFNPPHVRVYVMLVDNMLRYEWKVHQKEGSKNAEFP